MNSTPNYAAMTDDALKAEAAKLAAEQIAWLKAKMPDVINDIPSGPGRDSMQKLLDKMTNDPSYPDDLAAGVYQDLLRFKE